MRIIGGARRGLHLTPVGSGDPTAHLRPTSDRVREAMFNLLINGKAAIGGNPVAGANVLDLFAGTGALGLEALSRGAASVTFVDDGKVAAGLLRANIAKMQAGANTTVLHKDATRLGPNSGAGFDLVFVDPPYGKGLGQAALTSARAGGWILPDALVVWEESAPPPVPVGFALLDQRKYGDTVVSLLRAQ
jgi:16S rRNA (guanine966-N2)-methyltransferase